MLENGCVVHGRCEGHLSGLLALDDHAEHGCFLESTTEKRKGRRVSVPCNLPRIPDLCTIEEQTLSPKRFWDPQFPLDVPQVPVNINTRKKKKNQSHVHFHPSLPYSQCNPKAEEWTADGGFKSLSLTAPGPVALDSTSRPENKLHNKFPSHRMIPARPETLDWVGPGEIRRSTPAGGGRCRTIYLVLAIPAHEAGMTSHAAGIRSRVLDQTSGHLTRLSAGVGPPARVG